MRGARGGVKVPGRPRLEIKVPVFVPTEGVPLLALERLQAATIVADFVRRQAVDREQAAVTLVSRDLFGGRAGRHSAHSGVGRMVTVLRQLGEKARGRLRPGPCITAGDLAQMLADGARGVNQSLPPLPVDRLPERYRRMFAVILRGCVVGEDDEWATKTGTIEAHAEDQSRDVVDPSFRGS